MQVTTPRRATSTASGLQKTPSGVGAGLRRTTSGGVSAATTPRQATATTAPSSAASSAATTPAKPAAGSADASGQPPATVAASQNITVAVRVRAFHQEEPKDQLAIRMKDTTCEIHVPSRGRFPFSFDKCFWSNQVEDPEKEYSSQEDVFNSIGKPLVDNALAGFNSSIIAYGQTGSGKTYSIFGPANSLGTKDEGLIPRVCNDIFTRLARPEPGVQRKVFVSVLEVYLEDVYDLLQKRKELKVRGDSRAGFSVAGLKQIEVSEYTDVVKLIAQADTQKTFAATAIHDRSSRAHTLFQLEVRTITNKTTRTATVVLADLAGCERIKTAQTDTGLGFEQAKNINLSLLNLGTCIEAVVTRCRNNQTSHNIGEFRNSTLTKLLKDFIGGNARTAMLVTVAPGLSEQNLSIQALRFADRAKQIQCHAVINSQVNTDANKVKEEITKLYSKKRELLDKECELEMQQTMLRKKQADLEKMSFDLVEEKKLLRQQTEKENAAEAAIRQKREAEIEAKLKHLQRELADAQTQRESLDEKYLDMCEEQASLQHDKEQITQEHARLLEEVETLKQEHSLALADQDDAWNKKMEEALLKQRLDAKSEFEEAESCSQAKIKAVTIEYETKLRDQSGRHMEVLAQKEKDSKEMRAKLISREEDLALKSRTLTEKTEQNDVLAKAHQMGQRRIESLEADLKDAADQSNNHEIAIKELQEQLTEMSEANAATICDKADLERELNAKIESLKTEAAEVKSYHEDIIATLQQEKQDVSQELATTVSMLSKVEEEATSEKTKSDKYVAELLSQIADLKSQLDSKSSAFDQGNSKIAELQTQVSHLNSQLQTEEFAHSKTKLKLNAAIASTDEAEAQLKHNTQVLQEELAAEQKKVSTYRKRFYNSKNDRDMIHQQCVAAHNALGLALQSTFQYSDELTNNTGSPSASFTSGGPTLGSLASAAIASSRAASTMSVSSPSRRPLQQQTFGKENSLARSNTPAAGSPKCDASPTIATSTSKFETAEEDRRVQDEMEEEEQHQHLGHNHFVDPMVASPVSLQEEEEAGKAFLSDSPSCAGGDGGAPCSPDTELAPTQLSFASA